MKAIILGAIVALVALGGVSWWNFEGRAQLFLRKTNRVHQGMTEAELVRTMGSPVRVRQLPNLAAPCREHAAIKEMSFVFEDGSLVHKILRIEPPRLEYVTCIGEQGKVEASFMNMTEFR